MFDLKKLKFPSKHMKLFYQTIVCATTCWFLFSSALLISPLLDEINPLENGPRELIWPLHADYIFFDRENYFSQVFIHNAVATFSVMCIYTTQDTRNAIFIEHVCGLFAVTR